MPAPATPSARPRPSGGFNAGGDQFGEHLDEAAMQQAVKQKAQQQQAADPQGSTQQKKSRSGPINLQEELLKKPLQEIGQSFQELFNPNSWLGISAQEDEDPEEQMRKKVIHQRWTQLNEEQQAVAKQRYEELLAKQKQQEEEAELKKQQQAEQDQQPLTAPSSPQKGPIGPASGMSGKQKAKAQLDMNRNRMGQAQGSN